VITQCNQNSQCSRWFLRSKGRTRKRVRAVKSNINSHVLRNIPRWPKVLQYNTRQHKRG